MKIGVRSRISRVIGSLCFLVGVMVFLGGGVSRVEAQATLVSDLELGKVILLGDRKFVKIGEDDFQNAYLMQATAERNNLWARSTGSTAATVFGYYNGYASATNYGAGYYLKNQYLESLENVGFDLQYLVAKNWEMGQGITDANTYFSLISSDEWGDVNIRNVYTGVTGSFADNWWTRTFSAVNYAWAISGTTENLTSTQVDSYSYQIRPVVYLRGNLKVDRGSGAMGSPHTVVDEDLVGSDSCRHAENQNKVGCLPMGAVVKLGNRSFVRINQPIRSYGEGAYFMQTTSEKTNVWARSTGSTASAVFGYYNGYASATNYGAGYYLKNQYARSMVNAGLDLDYLVARNWNMELGVTDNNTKFSLIDADEWRHSPSIRQAYISTVGSFADNWWTRTFSAVNYAWAISGTTENLTSTQVDSYRYQIRPVVYLRGNLEIETGQGTIGNPYTVIDQDLIGVSSCRHTSNQSRVGCLSAGSVIELGDRSFVKVNQPVRDYTEEAYLVQTTSEKTNVWARSTGSTAATVFGYYNGYASATNYGAGYYLKNQYSQSLIDAGLDFDYLVSKNWSMAQGITDSNTYFSLLDADEWYINSLRDTYINTVSSFVDNWWTRTFSAVNYAWAISGTTENLTSTQVDSYSYQIRPVTYLRGDLKTNAGSGTIGSPYTVTEWTPYNTDLSITMTTANTASGIEVKGTVNGNDINQTMIVWADVCNLVGQCQRQTVTVNSGDPDVEPQDFTLTWPANSLTPGTYQGTIWTGLKAGDEYAFEQSTPINLTITTTRKTANLSVIKDKPFSFELGDFSLYGLTAGTDQGVTVANVDGKAVVSGTLSANTMAVFGDTQLSIKVVDLPASTVTNVTLY